MCKPYQCVIMLLIFIVFGIICFIYDSDNDSNEDYNNIITLLDVEINTTILITWPIAIVIVIGFYYLPLDI